MKYKKGFKYQNQEDEVFRTHLRPLRDVFTKFIALNTEGLLIVRGGYTWDGTSGPVADRKTNQTPSLAHDALYELSRLGLIPYTDWREYDKVFLAELKKRGAWKLTMWLDKQGLLLAKGAAAHPKNKKKVYTVA